MKDLVLVTSLLCLCGGAVLASDPCLTGPEGPAHSRSAQQGRPAEGDIAAIQAAIVAGVDPSMKLTATSAGPPYTAHPYLTAGHFGADTGSESCD